MITTRTEFLPNISSLNISSSMGALIVVCMLALMSPWGPRFNFSAGVRYLEINRRRLRNRISPIILLTCQCRILCRDLPRSFLQPLRCAGPFLQSWGKDEIAKVGCMIHLFFAVGLGSTFWPPTCSLLLLYGNRDFVSREEGKHFVDVGLVAEVADRQNVHCLCRNHQVFSKLNNFRNCQLVSKLCLWPNCKTALAWHSVQGLRGRHDVREKDFQLEKELSQYFK